ncbi:MAG: PAS domain S-box protein [Nitrospira sp.]|nr:PAS domain S-box protein [Nitrospira sp.]
MSGTGQLPELESLRTQLADVARELAERDRTLYEQTTNRDRQLQDLQEQSVWLRTIVEGTAADIGERFFASLVNQLTSTLQVQYAVIGIVTEAAPHTIHTIAVSSGGTLVRNFEYALSQTPCEAALKESFARFDSQVQDTFPKFELPGGVRIDSYCGVPIRIKSGAVIGILAIMDTKPLRKSEWIQSVLTLFAARAGAELQRQQAEAAQRAAESRLRFTQVAVDQSFDGVLWADDSTRFIYANDAVCRSLGYSREELLGLTIADIAPCHDPEHFQQRLDEITQGGAATYESVHRRKDGSEFPIEISVTYLEYEGTGYTCGFIRDITERQRVEQERLKALTDLRNITETVPDFMFTLDTQGNMVKWNHRVEEVTGYSPEELHGKSALAFVPPHEQEQTARAIQRAFTDGKAELEGHLITKDQRTIPYHWTGAVLKDLHGRIIGITGIGRDVSAQKETAEALQRQQHHLMEAQALAHLGSWEWDIESGDTVWSEEQFRIFGHEPGAIAVTYDTFLAALLPDDHDRVLAAVNDALLGKCPLDLECRIVRPNGDIRVIHMRADVQRDITAHPTAMAGTALDITERKQVEEALRASEERWHLAVQGSNDGIWDWNIQAGEIFFSARWKAMRGFADSEVRNHIDEWRSHIHPDDLDRVLQSIDHYLAKQTSAFCEEYRVQRKDGSYMWILDRGAALWADNGTPIRMTGSESDVTDRKLMEQALCASETRFAAFMTHLPGAAFIKDDAGRHVFANQGFEQVLGLKRNDWYLKTNEELFPPDIAAVFSQHDQTLRMQEHPLETVETTLHENETRHWLVKKYKIPGEQTSPGFIGGIAIDITERKQAEAALWTSEEQLRLAMEGSTDALWDARVGPDHHWTDPAVPLWWSPRIRQWLQLSESELFTTVGEWTDRLHPDDVAPVMAALAAHIEGCHAPYDIEYRLRTNCDTYLWVRGRGQAQWDEQGRPIRMSGSCQDITARKQADMALRESEARTRSILETALDAVVSINESGQIIGWNPQAEVMFGYSAKEVLGLPLEQTIIPARYRQAHTQGMDRMLQSGDGSTIHRRFEFFALHRSGREFPVEFAIAATQFGGRPMFSAFIRDITDRKRAEEALRESEERYRTLVELSPSGVFVFSEGRAVYVNSMAMTILGATESNDILARDPFEFIHPGYHEDVTQNLRRVLAGETTVHRAERVYLKMDGSPIHVQVEAVRITWNGKPAIQGFFSDITERRQAEHKLRLTQFTIDHAVDAIYWIDPQATIVDVNEAASEMLGYSKDELCAMTVYDLNPDFQADRWPAFWAETKQRGTATVETRHRAKDGRIVPVEVHISHLSYGENEYHCAFVRNITERKRTDAALRASEERLRTVVESSANGLVMVDGEGRIVLLNRQIERLFGYRREALIGRPIEVLIPPRFRMHHPSLRAAYQKTPETMMPIRGRDLYGMRQDGGEFPVEIELNRIETGNGPMTLASVMDLTERKRAEDKQKQLLTELAESQKHFEQIFHWTPSAVAISTLAEGRFLDVNDQLVQLTGYSREELIGHTTAELQLWAEPLERAHVIQEILQQRSLHNEEGLLRTKSGELRTIMVSVDRIQVKATPCLIYVAHDITERKQAEIAQARQYEALQAIFRMTVALSRASSLEELYEQGIDGVQRALKVDRASILLFDEDGVMRFKASRGLSEEYKMAVEGHSPWSRETVNPQPMLVEDVVADPSVAPYRKIFVGEGIAALGFIPLVSAEGLVGKFMLYYDTPHQFTAEEIQIAQTIASHVALMIQRKRAVAMLRHSERQLRTVLDSLPIGVWFTDRTGKTLLANPAAKQIWSNIKHVGLQTQDNPSGWWETLEPVNEPHRWALGHALTTGKSSLNETLDLEGLDGGTKTIRNTTVPVRDESGTVLGAVILNEDLTEIRRIQEALKLTQFSVDHAVEGFFWIGPDARILHVNDAACRMLEYSREELMAMTMHDIDPHFPPELWPAHWEELKQKGSVALESKQWSKTGRVLDMEITVSYLRYTGREYHCAIMRDIGERKKAEQALRESEDRLQRALEASGAGTWRVDLHTGLDTRDTGLNRLLGLPAETTVQPMDEWFTFLHPDDRPAMETAWQSASISGLYEVEHRLIRSDGAIRWVYDRGRFVRDEAGQPLYATGAVIDITERKRVEETLRQREDDLRTALEERERISQDLHDGILQSLYAIGLGLEACKSLQQQRKKTAKAITQALDQAVGQLNTVMGEVRNFIAGLDSDVLQSGKFSIALCAMIQMLVANHPMRCHLAIDETTVCRLSTEQALHMMNIIREAISNGLRHGHATKATVSLKPLARSIRLTIRDNGEGFEPADAHSLGHGLSNMRARAKKMGGHFTIQSAPDRGTRVTIDLPQETCHDNVKNQTDSAVARR